LGICVVLWGGGGGGGGGGVDPDINLTASGARNVESLRTVTLKLCLIVPAQYCCHSNVTL